MARAHVSLLVAMAIVAAAAVFGAASGARYTVGTGCNSPASAPPAAEVTNGTPGGPGANGTPGGVCLGGDSPTTIIMTPPGINNDGGSAPGSPSSANRLIGFLVVTMVSLLLGLLV